MSAIIPDGAYAKICEFENLYRAHKRARRGKRYKAEVMRFELSLNANLHELKRELENETYAIDGYKTFRIHEPKERLIQSLPYRDRVVQHSLCDNVLGPYLETRLIDNNVACRVGKGTLYGLDRLREFLRSHHRGHGTEGYILKGDVANYFGSVDHESLKSMLWPHIGDKRLRRLLEGIIGSTPDGVGLPLGNMTSQWFGLFYLDPLDRLVKERLRVKRYVRYMDDFVLVHEDKFFLKHCLVRIRALFNERLKLRLNAKTQIFPVKNGVDFLGFHTYLTETGKVIRKLRHDSAKRMKRKARAFVEKYRNDETDSEVIERSLYSWLGHAEHGDTWGLRRAILDKLILTKEETGR